MSTNRISISSSSSRGASVLQSLVQLLKVRLTLLVAISAVFGYAMAAGEGVSVSSLVCIGIGGFLITGGSNVLNQVFELEWDTLMKRTQHRPLPSGKLSITVSLIYAAVLAISGVAILGYFFNLASALLGIIGLLMYAFVYTPMKRVSPLCVFVGAIPGSLPPLIGWVAFTGSLGTEGILLFIFQFFWQFPHFWAIAWLLKDDYDKAGFQMLPVRSGHSKVNARLILIYTACLIPLAWFPIQLGMVGIWTGLALAVWGIAFTIPAWILFRKLEIKAAKWLMFSSFFYLPFIQMTFLIGAIH